MLDAFLALGSLQCIADVNDTDQALGDPADPGVNRPAPYVLPAPPQGMLSHMLQTLKGLAH